MKIKRLLTLFLCLFVFPPLVVMVVSSTSMAGEAIHVSIPGGIEGRTCFECHISGEGKYLPTKRTVKYSIAQAFATYLQSPHGRLRRLGDMRAPMCEDCHLTREWGDILPVEHPNSPINPANLPHICAKCHGKIMLDTKVAEGSMHLALAKRSLRPGEPIKVKYGLLPGLTKREKAYYIGPIDILAYVNWFFTIITVGTLSIVILYMVLDLRRKLIDRRAEKRGEEQ